jgi:predicted RecB family nuclease
MGIVIDEFYGDMDRADTEELVNHFGLGKRVSETLTNLGCRTITDLLKLKPNALTHYTTETTARRIMLLKKYAELRWPGT